ncbi:MAG: cysteine desulfurase DndA [Phenylobacterium sp. RIFCSPHIGHO2_01_FULL_69_31]|uniref:cysteine desulfurase DndA n=1 Tax=Phenylobacterium sp. RIFCSPHIGHO2_01_FULL_69_31 TaxID=1801944 RepID=UPI0008CEFBB6|nr:cysteine desulfurase DndA [Phenylobacterium sp. RIFCSPHIGHO2_01_FULL_69_31]OHB26291.1 MAG: cysteine desulfurase DndA [Phenylobacterium sp. RIFCSPHIGHO2_01_FULL_69_31]
MPVYLDNNATTPLAPQVRELMFRYFDEEYGNAASRTHEFGLRAKQAVQRARSEVAAVVAADPAEVVFTSGATEANNLGLLGLAPHGDATGRRHVITTAIEHKAVLEPLGILVGRGFEVTYVPVDASGRVKAKDVLAAVRRDTLLVSVMQANNETGVLQPIAEIAGGLIGHDAYFHVDAAQGFGKSVAELKSARVDLISISAHKVYGPKGVGALVARRRQGVRPPLTPLMYGGGHETGLRPGTLPVPLIAGFGAAASLANEEHARRQAICQAHRTAALAAFAPLGAVLVGDQAHVMPHVLMVAFPGVDSEALMLAAKDVAAMSNGSACTSASYAPSHVLTAMGLPADIIEGAVRLSWSHLGDAPPWRELAARVADLSAFA